MEFLSSLFFQGFVIFILGCEVLSILFMLLVIFDFRRLVSARFLFFSVIDYRDALILRRSHRLFSWMYIICICFCMLLFDMLFLVPFFT